MTSWPKPIESVRQLMKKYGLKFIRPKVVPGSPPPVEEQLEFIENYNKLKASRQPGEKIIFGDTMHLIHQSIPGYFWGDPKKPPVLETNSGRKRLNILGAYDPQSHSFVHLTGEENCNADRVIMYLELIAKSYPNVPKIRLILDNAKYFHANKVSEWIEKHNKWIEIIFLPSYAPNLNLIERFWRFAKEKLVKNEYVKEYKKFRAKVFQFLNHVDEYKAELKTLLVEKFEIVYV